jgi:ABC-2 type transport system permease protein
MSATIQKSNTNKRNKIGQRLFAIIALLVLVNIAAYFFYSRIDLTKDRRYTITPATKKMLRNLDNKVEVLVFLDGSDLPAAFQSLSQSTQSVLRNFRDISNNKISYRVIDPLGNDTTALQTLSQFRMSGIPVTINAGKKGTAQKMVFPWALVTLPTAGGESKAFPVFLQETNTPELSRKILMRSEILLEYNLANAIHQISRKEKNHIAYLTGNDEQFDDGVRAAFIALSRYYNLDTFNLGQNIAIPPLYKAIIINRPMVAFTEEDKFKLDQYLMNGGSIFWNINAVTGNLDSLQTGRYNAMPVDLNLNDLLFSYGVRVNTNLIEDAASSVDLPLMAGGNNASPTPFQWIYFPVLQPGSDHPIVKNTNGVLARFVSSIDTNSNDAGIKKTVLLSSSRYSKTEAAPLPVILESAMVPPNPATFPQKNLMAAVLLEGSFNSAYQNRQPESVIRMIDSLRYPMISKSKQPGKLIIAGDGDLLMNEFSEKQGPSDMGFYRYSDYRFDNKVFLMNSMEYLTDPDNLLAARTKNFDNRILDPKIVERERTTWQFINIGIPVISILVLGAVFFFLRKKRYA